MVDSLKTYLLGCYLVCVALCTGFLLDASVLDARGMLFAGLVLITYPAVYLAPALVLAAGRRLAGEPGSRRRWIYWALMLLSGWSASALLFGDLRLYDLFGFHINAFVINLVLTPGGIESLGASDEFFWSATWVVLMFGGLHGLWLAASLSPRLQRVQQRVPLGRLVVLLVLAAVAERLIFALSDAQNHRGVLAQAAAIPGYQRVTARGLLERLGVESARQEQTLVDLVPGSLDYPLHPLSTSSTTSRPNIIMLVAESLRADMLDPVKMPRTWALADQSMVMARHYSGGNGTRQGLFSLFYSLHGSYWPQFLRERRGPVLMDILQRRGYDIRLNTSASFTYPEFDQTLFAAIPASQMHQTDMALSPWQRDEQNTGELVDYLKSAPRDKPFFLFMFYESTHARYDFPPERAIRKQYSRSVNYATMDRESLAKDIEGLRNRYVNASHYVDSQMGRIYDVLQETGLLANTVLVVTGDHGEEFMEHGFWGHNSGYTEEQIRVPMVMHLPGARPARLNRMTSHLDLVPTLLPLLGVRNSRVDYALGEPFTRPSRRNAVVVSDWQGVAMVSEEFKFFIPLANDMLARNRLWSAKDRELTDVGPFLSRHRQEVNQLLRDARKFIHHAPG